MRISPATSGQVRRSVAMLHEGGTRATFVDWFAYPIGWRTIWPQKKPKLYDIAAKWHSQ
jgi:hypothetical protein